MVSNPLEILQTHVGTICARCPNAHITDDGRLRCRAMSDLAIVPLITRGWPFCPLWYHTFGLPAHTRLLYALRWYLSAAIKRVASTLRVCRAKPDVIAMRLSRCDECVHRDKNRCGQCGCPLAHKTALATESCPLKPSAWGPVASRGCKLLTWLERQRILFTGPPPAFFARLFRTGPWGGTAPGCQACNNADQRHQT